MKTIDFIVNPIAGGKDKTGVLTAIRNHLDGAKYRSRILMTEKAGDATQFALDSAADIVVAVGGDGTVSEVAHGLMGTEKALGIIPCGSGDGLALHLGLSRHPDRAVKTLNEGCMTYIDVATINGHPFFCTAGFGLDADVSQEFARSTQRGVQNYIALAWDEWKHHPTVSYALTADEESWSGKALLVTVANCNQWGNQARIAPMASIQDGLLDVIVVRPFHTLEVPEMAVRLMAGKADTSRHVLHFSASGIRIHRDYPGAYHIDGDPYEGGTDFELSVQPGALQVLVPSANLPRL